MCSLIVPLAHSELIHSPHLFDEQLNILAAAVCFSFNPLSYNFLFTPHARKENFAALNFSLQLSKDRKGRGGRENRDVRSKEERTHQGELDFHIIYPTEKHIL